MSTPHYFESSYEQYLSIVAQLSAQESQTWSHGEIESDVQDTGTELMRRLVQSHLDLRYSQEGYQQAVIGAAGEARPHRRKKTQRQLETLFGEVVVTRVGYSTQKPEVSALYPSDGQLNLPTDKYSDGLRRQVAEEASKVSFSETSETIGRTTGGRVRKRQCEEVTVKVAQDFEAFYAQRTGQVSAGAEDLLVLSTDGKGIVMHSAKATSHSQGGQPSESNSPDPIKSGPETPTQTNGDGRDGLSCAPLQPSPGGYCRRLARATPAASHQ